MIKTLVTYMTVSGNTKKVAEAIFEAVEGAKDIKPMNEVTTLENYDLTFVGFPVMRFGPPDQAKDFLEKKAKGKRVAIFVTHAMWADLEPLKGILMKCQEPASCAEMVGFFDCQGELSEAVATSLLNSSNPEMQRFGQMRPKTMGHPNADDLAKAKDFAVQMRAKK